MPPFLQTHSFTIPTGAGAYSGTVDVEDGVLVGIITSPAFTGTLLNVKVSADGTTFQVLRNDANVAVQILITAGAACGIDAAAQAMAPWQYFQFGSDANEASARTMTLVAKSTAR